MFLLTVFVAQLNCISDVVIPRCGWVDWLWTSHCFTCTLPTSSFHMQLLRFPPPEKLSTAPTFKKWSCQRPGSFCSQSSYDFFRAIGSVELGSHLNVDIPRGNVRSEWLFYTTVDLNHCLFLVKTLKRIPFAKHWPMQLKEYKKHSQLSITIILMGFLSDLI